MSYIFSLIVFLNHPFCNSRFFQLFQNEYPFMDYYNFLFTMWIFLYNQDPEDETLVLLNHFDFLTTVNYVYNVMNIICQFCPLLRGITTSRELYMASYHSQQKQS